MSKKYSTKQLLIMVLHRYEEELRKANPNYTTVKPFVGLCYVIHKLWGFGMGRLTEEEHNDLLLLMKENTPKVMYSYWGGLMDPEDEDGFWWELEDTKSRIEWLKTQINSLS